MCRAATKVPCATHIWELQGLPDRWQLVHTCPCISGRTDGGEAARSKGAPCTSALPGRRHRPNAPVVHTLRALAVRLCAEAPATWPCTFSSLRLDVSCQATLA